MGSINGPMSAKSHKSSILTNWAPLLPPGGSKQPSLENWRRGDEVGVQAAYVQKSRALAICGEGPIVTLVVWDAFIALALSVPTDD